MKRILSLFLVALLLLCMLFSFTACSTVLRGTYSSQSAFMTYTFDGGRVSKSLSFFSSYTDIGSDSAAIMGKYDIDYEGAKEGYSITFTWDDSGKSETHTFKKMNGYILIDGVKYTRSE